MPDAGSTIQPMAVAQLYCPRCWFTRPFYPIGALTFRCAGCEWLFTLAAPSVAAPAVPATTVTAANTTGTVVAAAIAANGATISNVSVNGATAGSSAGTYLVPVAGTISIAYTVATPTWTWALPTISTGVSAAGTALPFAAFGTAFAQGQVLIVDPSGTSDVVTVNGAPTGTSVPVTALNASHLTGVSVTVAVLTTTLSGVENVPLTAY